MNRRDEIVLGGIVHDNTIAFGDCVAKSDAGVSAGTGYVVKFLADGKPVWIQQLGEYGLDFALGPNDEIAVVTAVQATKNVGGCSVTSAGGLDIVLARLATDGRVLWARSFGDSMTDAPGKVAIDDAGGVTMTGSIDGTVDFGGGPLVATTNGTRFFASFAANGAHLRSKVEPFLQTAFDGARSGLFAGGFTGQVDFGRGPLKVDAGGNASFLVKFPP